jgi:hypothetical protein
MIRRILNKNERITIAELFVDGFTITELALMYDVSIFRIMGVLNKLGVEV